MMQLNGAQLMVRLLERQGVRTIAGIPGGAILPFYDALSGSELTGRGGALNKARTTREICHLNVLAASARVSVYELD